MQTASTSRGIPASASLPAQSSSIPFSASQSGASSSPSTLKPVTSSTGFVYPAIWSFPPLFTLQPHHQTLAHQLDLWVQLLLSWCRFHRVFRIDSEAVDGGVEVFHNRGIQRRLLAPGIKQLLAHMQKTGTASPESPKQPGAFFIYWRKPDEWATVIYTWVSDNGMTGSIMTFYELTEGDLAHTTDFHMMPPALLRRALDVLVKTGRAQVFKGEDAGSEGVKFF